MSRIGSLVDAGFSNEDIAGYVNKRWTALEEGGFTLDEIHEYFGIDPEYSSLPGAEIGKEPTEIPDYMMPIKPRKPETPFQKVASMYAEAGLKSKADVYYMMAGLGRFMGHDFGSWLDEMYYQAARESEDLAESIKYDPENVFEKIDKKIVDGVLGLLNPKLSLMGVPTAYGGAEFLSSYGKGGDVPQAMIEGAKSVIMAKAFGKIHGMGKAESGLKMGTLGATQSGSEMAMQNLNPEDVAYASLEGFTTMGIFGAMSGGKLSVPAQKYYQRTVKSLGEEQAMSMAKAMDQAIIGEMMRGARYEDVVESLRIIDEELVPLSEKEKEQKSSPEALQLKEGATVQGEEAKAQEPIQEKQETVRKEEKEPWEMTRDEFNSEAEKILSAAIVANNEIIKGATHGEAINDAIRMGKVLDTEDGYIDLQGNNISWNGGIDLFITSKGRIIDRFEADDIAGVTAGENIGSGGNHKKIIEHALNLGKPVPPEVLKDYPELTPKVEETTQYKSLFDDIMDLGGVHPDVFKDKNYSGELQELFYTLNSEGKRIKKAGVFNILRKNATLRELDELAKDLHDRGYDNITGPYEFIEAMHQEMNARNEKIDSGRVLKTQDLIDKATETELDEMERYYRDEAKSALRESNPDWSEDQIEKELRKIEADQDKEIGSSGKIEDEVPFDIPGEKKTVTLGSGLGGAQDIYEQTINAVLAKIKEGREDAAEAYDAWETTKDVWIGQKDERILRARVECGVLQREIRQALGLQDKRWYRARQVVDASFERHARDVDQAIQIAIELEAFPEKKAELWDKLTEEQQRIVELSENLPPEIQEIADIIKARFKDIGLESYEAEIIHNVRENYVGHIWDIEGKKGGEGSRKFGTTTGHAKARKFDTILDGWASGYELKIKGATNSLRAIKEEIIKTIEDKRFLDAMGKVKNIDGDPLISPYKINDDYIEIQHPNFKKYKFATKIDLAEKEVFGPKNLAIGDFVRAKDRDNIGKITSITNNAVSVQFKNKEKGTEALVEFPVKDQMLDKNVLVRVKPKGQNFIIQDDGTVLERVRLYAPKKVSDNLNNILGVSKLNDVPGIKTLTKYNAQMKAWILQSSLFHHQAFMRSYYLGTNEKAWDEMNVISAYKAGLKAIEEFSPELMRGVRKGLTLGIRQDWEENLLREKTIIGRGLESAGLGQFKDKILELRDMQADYLFNDLGAGLKAKAYLIEYRNHMKRNPNMDPDIAAEQVARLINNDFGGLNLQRMGRNPTTQHIMRLFLLAPDWTESNVRTIYDGLKAVAKGDMAEAELYGRFWTGVVWKGIAATAVANFILAGGDIDEMKERYDRAWREGNLNWAKVDITPIYKAMGGQTSRRKYFKLTGHFMDPMKWAAHPLQAVRHKSSVVGSMAFEVLTGEDWAGRRYTTLEELIKDQQTVAWGKGHAINYDTLPSFVVSQIIGTQPVQIQNLIAWQMGEEEAFDAIAKGMGLAVTSTY